MSGTFIFGGKEITDTIRRGETKVYEDKRDGCATIEGDDYEYELLDRLVIECRQHT